MSTATETWVEAALGRPQGPAPLTEPLERLAGRRVLVTGAAGSIGAAVTELLAEAGIAHVATDRDDCDVRSHGLVRHALRQARPDLVLHLAASKSAPGGETDPWGVAETNVIGTRHVLEAAAEQGARVVTASTCKACDPETAYGASKLLAERMTLVAGGSVARYFNVVETSGNVFELWDALLKDEPVPVTPCSRYFISLAEAAALTLWAAVLPPGRYVHYPGWARRMVDVAAALYPDRPQVEIRRRRGDRLIEPLVGGAEALMLCGHGLARITGAHDPEPA